MEDFIEEYATLITIIGLGVGLYLTHWLTLGFTGVTRGKRRSYRTALIKAKIARLIHYFAIIIAWFSTAATESKYNSRVRKAKERLEIEEGHKGYFIDSLAGVRLYERWIKTPNGGVSLEDVVATVEIEGERHLRRRATVTRAVVGGVAARKVLGPYFMGCFYARFQIFHSLFADHGVLACYIRIDRKGRGCTGVQPDGPQAFRNRFSIKQIQTH